MELIIKSRKFKREITFSRPGNCYIYVDLNGEPGTLGRQICEGGAVTGSTIFYTGESQKTFERICRNWWRAYIKPDKDV